MAVVLLVTVAVAIPGWVVQAGGRGTIAASAARHGDAARTRTLAFWTPARMRSAVPRELQMTGDGSIQPGTRHLGIGFVRGAAWPNGLGRVYRATGKAFFRLGSQLFVCSGSVVTDGSTARSLVLTAGHCAYDFTIDRFATDWLFIPEYDAHPGSCGQSSYGCWTASHLAVHQGFATADVFDEALPYDFAVAVVGTGDRGTQLDATVGTFRLTTAGTTGEKRYLFGYPAADAYAGNTNLVYCSGRTFNDSKASNLTWGVRCNMTGGASGGPWFSAFDPSTGYGRITSLNSYGYTGLPVMFGPKFNQDTLDVYNAARITQTNKIVP